MKFLSVCSGIEAASVAWGSLGWEAVAFSEIEPFPCAVLAAKYPDVPNFGDMTKFKEWPDANFDVLVGGTPCQSFSVAGLRKGLADPRGNLMLTYLAIAERYRPEWLVWENVPGVLSSGEGRDFGSLLGGLAELGYGFAYRILDAQFFGVAQRRRRVFVVANARGWQRAAAVLFERASMSGNTAPRRESGERTAPRIAAGTKGGGGLGTDTEPDGGLMPSTVGALTDGAHNGGDLTVRTHTAEEFLPLVANPLTARMHKGINTTADEGQTPIITIGGGFDVAHSLRGDAFDASEDGTGRGTPIISAPHAFDARQSGCIQYGEKTGPLDTDGNTIGVLAFSGKDYGADAGEIAPTLRSMNNAHALGADGFDASEDGTGCGTPLAPVLAFAIQGAATRENPASGPDGIGVRTDDQAYTLEARSEVQAVGFAQNQRDEVRTMAVAGALASEPGMKQQTYIQQRMHVRRLTPRECERLQGFPDDYTLIQVRGKLAADGPRYKALGNSMAVPVMRWLGERIAQVAPL